MEQRKIIQNATRRNKLKSGGTDVNETIEAEGNLQDVIELLANLRKNKEPLLHCSVFIELKARSVGALKELQSDIAMELTRSKISVDRLTLRQKEGFLSVIPTGYNQFGAQYERVLPAYLAGKIRLTEAEVKDVLRAIRNFEIAAENGNDYAEYQLGKIYLYGKKVERDDTKAIAYLSSAAEHGNPYAEQLLHSIRSNRHWSAALGAIRLLHHLSRMIQNQLDDEKREKAGAIDRKLKRRIDEKKQAHGLKQG